MAHRRYSDLPKCRWFGRCGITRPRLRVSSWVPCVGGLEERRLLSDAVPLPFGSPCVGVIAEQGADFYQVTSASDGLLTATVQAAGFAARLSLVDSQYRPVVQSDAPAPGAAAGGDLIAEHVPARIAEHVPAGLNFLEVQSLGGAGSYTLTAHLTPAAAPFQTVPTVSPPNVEPIALGDFNGDGRPDLVAPDGVHIGVGVPDLVAPDGVHIGDGTFSRTAVGGPIGDPTEIPTAIAVGDFNGDGRPDLAVAETSPDGVTTSDVRVLLNTDGGTFQLAQTLAVDSSPDAILAADLGDGQIDLAVASFNTGKVALFRGDRHGHFTPAPGPTLDGGDHPSALVAADFNGDHIPDLVVADRGEPITGKGQGLRVYQGEGQGAFQFVATLAVNTDSSVDARPAALVAGDFGNGHLDLAVANQDSNDVSVLLGNGNGTFQPPRTYNVGQVPESLVACDFNGDGRLDLATANVNSGGVSILLGNRDGTFQAEIRAGAGTQPEALAADDFNGDHRPDLAVANYGSGDVSVLLGRGDGTFQDQTRNPVGNDPVSSVTADFNRDGHLDLVTADALSNDVSVLLGHGDGTFQTPRKFPAGASPNAVVVGDFNGDGRLDLAVADGGDPVTGKGRGVSVLLGNGDGTFQTLIHYDAGQYPTALVAGDFNRDGRLDLAVTNGNSDDVSILLGDGHGGFQPPLPPTPLGDAAVFPWSITAGDFGNGQLDLAVANRGSNNVSILLGDGHGHFRALAPIALGTDSSYSPVSIVAGPFDKAGPLDLAVASYTLFNKSDVVTILRGNGAGGFQPLAPIPLGVGAYPMSLTAADLQGNRGTPDLLVAEDGTSPYQVAVLLGDGDGTFQFGTPIELGDVSAPISITTGDFTGKGRPDLAIGLSSPNDVAVMLNQEDGQFTDPGSAVLAPLNTPLVADLNGDGIPDVTVVDGAGDILFRQGQKARPGSFDPPITVNPGDPSRDIVAVDTHQGPVLASVDATDDYISLYAWGDGHFVQISSPQIRPLRTGSLPAQIVTADLNGDGWDDLVVRNAGLDKGDNTLTVFFSNDSGSYATGNALFPSWVKVTLPVGPGVSGLAVADVNRDGRPDLLVTNQVTGTVEVLLNQIEDNRKVTGDGAFSPPTIYRAGVGLSEVTGGDGTAPLTLASREATTGVAVRTLTPDGPSDLVTLNPGSNTLGVLTGLGGGRFTNPVSIQTAFPALSVRVADVDSDGVPDVIVLSASGVSVYRGDFLLSHTYDAGLDPTGLTVADINHDGKPDLLVGNSFGDLLVLLGNGDGTFQPYRNADQNVALAVLPNGSPTPDFIYADQSLDRVVVDYGGGQKTVVGDRSTGLLVPGAVQLADLNGDGIPDLIVANSGSNNVLIYPGLGNGQFGPALNGGHGFSTGTNPVGLTVVDVNGDGRPDLVVANKGSNAVSVLINESQGNSITFASRPRLNVGYGPVSTVVKDVTGDGIPDLLVSNSQSNNVMLLPGVGGGNFNDQNPTVIPMPSPGPIYPFGPDVVVLHPESNIVTLIDFTGPSPITRTFGSGGLGPVDALVIPPNNGNPIILIVVNRDGHVARLESGPQGLDVEQSLDLPNPTALALASFQINVLDVYAATEGEESATLLVFFLGGSSPPIPHEPPGAPDVPTPFLTPLLFLIPFRESALPLLATLLVGTTAGTQEEADEALAGADAEVTTATTATVSLGQGLFAQVSDWGGHGTGDEVADEEPVVSQTADEDPGASPWACDVLGLDEAFEQFRRKVQDHTLLDDTPEEGAKRLSPTPDGPSDRGPQADRRTGRLEIIDMALDALGAEDRTPTPTPSTRSGSSCLIPDHLADALPFRTPRDASRSPSWEEPEGPDQGTLCPVATIALLASLSVSSRPRQLTAPKSWRPGRMTLGTWKNGRQLNADFRGRDKNQPFRLAMGRFSRGSCLSSSCKVNLFGT